MNAEPLTQEQIRTFILPAHGNLEIVKQMLADEPRFLDACYEEWNETGLGAASHVGNRPIAEFLLEQGAELTIYAAAMLGRRDDVAQFLDDDPALINSGGAHNISLLFHAAMSGDVEMVKMLVERGNTQSPDQPLLGAVSYGRLDMAKWLLDRGANTTATNFQNKTALDIAKEREDEALIELLSD